MHSLCHGSHGNRFFLGQLPPKPSRSSRTSPGPALGVKQRGKAALKALQCSPPLLQPRGEILTEVAANYFLIVLEELPKSWEEREAEHQHQSSAEFPLLVCQGE